MAWRGRSARLPAHNLFGAILGFFAVGEEMLAGTAWSVLLHRQAKRNLDSGEEAPKFSMNLMVGEC
jgi:hypothetical protein